MPTLITRGVSSAYGFGLTTATGGRYGWAALLTSSTTSQSVYPYALRVTSSGSYVVLVNQEALSYIVTINSTGDAISSDTTFDNSGQYSQTQRSIVLDATDNIYSVGLRTQAVLLCCCVYQYSYWTGVAKTNSASSNLGSTYFGPGNFHQPVFYDISKFSDGTVLASGFTFTTNAWPAMVKFNSALTTVSWGIQNSDNVYMPLRTTVDSSDNVVSLRVRSAQVNIIKTNSAGTITNKSYLNGLGAYYWFVGGSENGIVGQPTTDSSNNIYFPGNYYYPYTYGCCCACIGYLPRAMVISVNSTATTVRFAKGYVGTGTIQSPTTLAKDSSDNMYFACYYQGSGKTGAIIFKVNSSGVLQWARSFTSSSYPPSPTTLGVATIQIDGTNFIYAGSGGGSNKSIVLKMPTDGSGSGTTFSLGGITYTYGTPTDFSVVDLALTLATETGSGYASYTPSLTTSGLAPLASTKISLTNKKI